MFRSIEFHRRASGAVAAPGPGHVLGSLFGTAGGVAVHARTLGTMAMRVLERTRQARTRHAAQRGQPRGALNLALQGGGARGAFTWGVLDRLLEEPGLAFDGVSGTSAGAVNAVLMAGGLAAGGREAARDRLARFWRGISLGSGWTGAGFVADMMMRAMSPYQFNPLDLNPLRQALDGLVEFETLCRRSGLRLYIAATDVHDGRPRIFGPDEVSCDAVLASASLPHIHRAVAIDGRHYWDGGYSANPALTPLVSDCDAADTLIVQLIPTESDGVPTTTAGIRERLNDFTFSEPLRNEVARLETARCTVDYSRLDAWRLHRRAAAHRFHLIDATPWMRDLGPGSAATPDWPLISRLFDRGRAAAERWLDGDAAAVGKRSSADLASRFL